MSLIPINPHSSTKIVPPSLSDADAEMLGDLNGDGIINVLDIVTMVNIVLNGGDYNPLADLNDDGINNILDIVTLVNLVLNP